MLNIDRHIAPNEALLRIAIASTRMNKMSIEHDSQHHITKPDFTNSTPHFNRAPTPSRFTNCQSYMQNPRARPSQTTLCTPLYQTVPRCCTSLRPVACLGSIHSRAHSVQSKGCVSVSEHTLIHRHASLEHSTIS